MSIAVKAMGVLVSLRSWGNHSSVTGAVGLLDRAAPLCFAAPVFFHAARWHSKLAA